jgi:DNA (cytosine-5)-methyltransferase 1
VPGVYSAGKPGGSDFAAFVGTLAKFGYHIAYRTLNAEYFGVPQRRRRCILVGYLGDWRPAAAVLFESESLRRDIKKGRKKGEGIASSPQGGPGPSVEYFDFQAIGKYGNDGSASTLMARDYKDAKDLVVNPVCATGETTHCLTSSHRGSEDGTGRGTPIVIDRAAFNQGVNAQYEPHIEATETMDTLISKGPHAVGVPFRKAKRASTDQDDETWVEADKANTLNLFDLGDTRTTHAIVEPCLYENHAQDSRVKGPLNVAPTVAAKFGTGGGNVPLVGAMAVVPLNAVLSKGPHAVGCYPINTLTLGGRPDPVNDRRMTMGVGNNGDPQFTLQAAHSHAVATVTPMAVRRLTPEECEALQGFPKGYSRIPWKGKPASECPDGPRYKACGNSMAVPVMRWVGERIALVDKLISQSQPEQPKP